MKAEYVGALIALPFTIVVAFLPPYNHGWFLAIGIVAPPLVYQISTH